MCNDLSQTMVWSMLCLAPKSLDSVCSISRLHICASGLAGAKHRLYSYVLYSTSGSHWQATDARHPYEGNLKTFFVVHSPKLIYTGLEIGVDRFHKNQVIGHKKLDSYLHK